MEIDFNSKRSHGTAYPLALNQRLNYVIFEQIVQKLDHQAIFLHMC